MAYIRSARAVANSYARRRRRSRKGAYRLEQNYVEFKHSAANVNGGGYGTNDDTHAQSTQLTTVPQLVNLNKDADQMTTPSNLCNIPRGTSVNTRVGRRIWLKSVQLSGNMTLTAGAASISSVVFNVALCKYRDCDKRKPTIGDIFHETFPPMRKVEHMSDYQILKIWKKTVKLDFEVDTAGTSYVGTATVPFTCFKKINSMVEFTPDSDSPITSADIEKNHMFFVAWTSTDSGTSTLNFLCRLRYIDM